MCLAEIVYRKRKKFTFGSDIILGSLHMLSYIFLRIKLQYKYFFPIFKHMIIKLNTELMNYSLLKKDVFQ